MKVVYLTVLIQQVSQKLENISQAYIPANTSYFVKELERMSTLNSWGGQRKGSGRPSTGRSKKVLYITDEEYLKVKQLIEQLRKPSE
jgi:hypothetical protein